MQMLDHYRCALMLGFAKGWRKYHETTHQPDLVSSKDACRPDTNSSIISRTHLKNGQGLFCSPLSSKPCMQSQSASLQILQMLSRAYISCIESTCNAFARCKHAHTAKLEQLLFHPMNLCICSECLINFMLSCSDNTH